MKSNTLNYSLLAVGVAAVMGISTGANAATPNTTGGTSAGAGPISNVATAAYSVAGVSQPSVTSNTVVVNVSETANFSLVSIVADGSPNNDTAVDQSATPGGTTTFTHALTNTGNVTDTYTVNATGADSALVTAVPNYNLGTLNPTTIAYTIVQADGTALTPAQKAALPAGLTETGTIANGATIKLPPTYRANLTYVAQTPTDRNGNDKGVGSLTATSAFFTTNAPTIATLTNENQTIVRLPTYKIVKTATSTVDLTAANPQITYGINVLNATTVYSDTATNFVIRDVLPLGMTLTSAGVTATGATVTSSGRTADGRVIIDVAVASLAVGASQAISFTVNVAPASYTSASSSATNNVEVYDKIIGAVGTLPVDPVLTTNYDILDSTNNTIDGTRVPALLIKVLVLV